MDVIAYADGDIDEDARRHPVGENQQTNWHEIHNADVLVHRQGGQRNRRVLHTTRKRQVVPLRQAGHQHCCAERKGRHLFVRRSLFR